MRCPFSGGTTSFLGLLDLDLAAAVRLSILDTVIFLLGYDTPPIRLIALATGSQKTLTILYSIDSKFERSFFILVLVTYLTQIALTRTGFLLWDRVKPLPSGSGFLL